MTAKVCAALVAAQADLTNPPKDKVAKLPTHSYRYADLATILDHIRPVLAKHGLAITQDVSMVDGRLLIHTRVVHSSGEVLEYGPLAGTVGTKWQDVGSGVTYARRYALQAVLAIAADDDDVKPEKDDDGASATPPSSAQRSKSARPRQADEPKPTASDEQFSAWVHAITESPDRDALDVIAAQIKAHDMPDAERQELRDLFAHKWEALA